MSTSVRVTLDRPTTATLFCAESLPVIVLRREPRQFAAEHVDFHLEAFDERGNPAGLASVSRADYSLDVTADDDYFRVVTCPYTLAKLAALIEQHYPHPRDAETGELYASA